MITKQKILTLLGSDFVSKTQVARMLGYKDVHNIDYLLQGLDRVCKTKYLATDVADRIMSTVESR